jgi:aspartyl-tRNA(Asn)/glutamyl-tRNA(Gln) amidotransferase subunit C
MTKSKLTNDDILHIAALANITLTDQEVVKFARQLEETINYVENLDELDTHDVKPTSHSTDLENVYFEDGTANQRLFSQKEATENASSTKNGLFVVNRILE